MRLRDWRVDQGWTQQRLADELACAISTVARYENGTRIPEFEQMKRLYVISGGKVAPNDIYGISAWEAARICAEGDAELARKAA